MRHSKLAILTGNDMEASWSRGMIPALVARGLSDPGGAPNM